VCANRDPRERIPVARKIPEGVRFAAASLRGHFNRSVVRKTGIRSRGFPPRENP